MTKTFLCAASLLASLSPLAAQPWAKWLAIGDSITLHGPKADLGWEPPTRGMAASALAQDYVHVLESRLKQRDAANAQDVKVVGRVGKLSAGTMEQMVSVLAELRDWNADLITIQLGENDHLKEIGAEGFEQRYRLLVDTLLAVSKPPLILCTGVWAPGEGLDPATPSLYRPGSNPRIKDDIIAKICAEKGLRFVPIAAAAADKANHGWGSTNGVKWHPNDAGMQAYADALYGALYPDAAGK